MLNVSSFSDDKFIKMAVTYTLDLGVIDAAHV